MDWINYLPFPLYYNTNIYTQRNALLLISTVLGMDT